MRANYVLLANVFALIQECVNIKDIRPGQFSPPAFYSSFIHFAVKWLKDDLGGKWPKSLLKSVHQERVFRPLDIRTGRLCYISSSRGLVIREATQHYMKSCTWQVEEGIYIKPSIIHPPFTSPPLSTYSLRSNSGTMQLKTTSNRLSWRIRSSH